MAVRGKAAAGLVVGAEDEVTVAADCIGAGRCRPALRCELWIRTRIFGQHKGESGAAGSAQRCMSTWGGWAARAAAGWAAATARAAVGARVRVAATALGATGWAAVTGGAKVVVTGGEKKLPLEGENIHVCPVLSTKCHRG